MDLNDSKTKNNIALHFL